jgi:hypothetical protein
MGDEDYSNVLRTSSLQSSENRVHKASSTSQQSPNGSGLLNPRSCVTCRRRKVKCDKKPVCTNCIKAHIECIYPSPGRAPRKPRKPQDSELIDRLKKLEGVVQMLGSQVQPEDGSSPAKDGEKPTEGEGTETHEEKIKKAIRELKDLKRQRREAEGDKKQSATTGLENRFGRLVVDEGRSRYINPSFWASLSNEVRGMLFYLL